MPPIWPLGRPPAGHRGVAANGTLSSRGVAAVGHQTDLMLAESVFGKCWHRQRFRGIITARGKKNFCLREIARGMNPRSAAGPRNTRAPSRFRSSGPIWRKLKPSGHNPRHGDVLIKVFPSQGVTIQLDGHLLQVSIRCPAKPNETVGGKSHDAAIGQFHEYHACFHPNTKRRRFRNKSQINDCGTHDTSRRGIVGVRKRAARCLAGHEPRSLDYEQG